MTRKYVRKDPLLTSLEKEALALLKDDKLTTQEKLKAIEVGAKIAGIKHKVQDGDRQDGSFFANK